MSETSTAKAAATRPKPSNRNDRIAYRGLSTIISAIRAGYRVHVGIEDLKRMLAKEVDLSKVTSGKASNREYQVLEKDVVSLAATVRAYVAQFVRLADVPLPEDLWSRDVAKYVQETGTPGVLWNGVRVNGLHLGNSNKLLVHPDDVPKLVNLLLEKRGEMQLLRVSEAAGVQ